MQRDVKVWAPPRVDLRGQYGGMKVGPHGVDLRVVGTHFPYTCNTNKKQDSPTAALAARTQIHCTLPRRRAWMLIHCTLPRRRAWMQIHCPLPRQRGQDHRILPSLPSACGHASRSDGFVRGYVQQQRACRQDANPLPISKTTAGHGCTSTTRCRGNEGRIAKIALRWVGCSRRGQYSAILPALPRQRGQWIHVHARRLGSKAFRTVTGRQLPLDFFLDKQSPLFVTYTAWNEPVAAQKHSAAWNVFTRISLITATIIFFHASAASDSSVTSTVLAPKVLTMTSRTQILFLNASGRYTIGGGSMTMRIEDAAGESDDDGVFSDPAVLGVAWINSASATLEATARTIALFLVCRCVGVLLYLKTWLAWRNVHVPWNHENSCACCACDSESPLVCQSQYFYYCIIWYTLIWSAHIHSYSSNTAIKLW